MNSEYIFIFVDNEAVAHRPKLTTASANTPTYRGITIMDEFSAAYDLVREEQVPADNDLYTQVWADLADTYPASELELVDDCGPCAGCKHLTYTTKWVCSDRTFVEDGLTQYLPITCVDTCTRYEKPTLPKSSFLNR